METLSKYIVKCLSLVCCLLFFSSAHATAFNDTPCNAINLPISTSCTSISSSNATATSSGIPDPGCAGYGGSDVWFSFVMPNNGYHVTIEMTAGSLLDGGMAVYEGPDCNTLALVSCDDNSGIGFNAEITVDDGCNFEHVGRTFWVRVWENGNDNNGSFDICAYAHTPATPAGTISCLTNPNPIPGNACCDAILLTEILDGYCANTTSFTNEPASMGSFCANIENNFWIAFNASDPTVEIEITSSNCTLNRGVQAGIFETADCSNFTIVSDCSNPNAVTTDTMTANNLIPGETYYIMVDGWIGDYCDVTFHVIGGVENTFAGATDTVICLGDTTTLFADVVGIGPYTYSWSPVGSLLDPANSASPRAKPSVSTNYSVTITGPSGNSIHSVSVTVVNNPPNMIQVNGPGTVCENSTNVQYSVSANNASSYSWTTTGGASIVGSASGSTVAVNWGAAGGSVCVDVANGCGTVGPNCLAVTTMGRPIISAQAPSVTCAPGVVDLTTISVSNSGSSGGFLTYHASQTDAEAGTPTLSSPVVSNSGTYWIRMESAANCYDVTSVAVTIEDPQISIVQPPPACGPYTIDLANDVAINETNGFSGGTMTFHTDSLDATVKLNAMLSTSVSASGVFYVRYETVNGCFDVERITVVIDPGPDLPDVINPAPLCPGSSVDLDTLTLPEANGVVIATKYFYSSLTLAQFGIPTFAMSNTIVSDDASYWVRLETSLGCFDIAEVDIDLATPPSGAISGSGTVCPGDEVDLTFSLTGTGPFDVVYNDGNADVTLTGISDGHIEKVTINSNTSFSLVSVSDPSGCAGTISGGPASFTVSTPPTASISGSGNLCEGSSAQITFNFSGSGPFDIVYQDDQSNSYNLAAIADGHQVSHTFNAPATYTLVSVTDNMGCSGNVSGATSFTLFAPLATGMLTETCNAAKSGYTVSFTISGGDAASYSVSGGAGTLQGSIFTSDEIAAGATYDFTISDASGCPSINVSGTKTCDCATAAGSMDAMMLAVCASQSVTATHNSDEVLDPAANDLLQFVLHDGSGSSLGNVFAISNSASFGMQAGMMTGTTYYISPIAGPDDGSGNIDQSHACFDVSAGTPVQFLEEPDVTISGTAMICLGDSFDLAFNILAGVPPLDVVISDGVQNISIDDVVDGSTWRAGPTVNTNYTIVSVVDNTSAACAGTYSGMASITVRDVPVVSNIQKICNGTNTQFQVTFEVNGGNPAAYQFSGDAGSFDAATNTFTSTWIANEGAYYFEVADDGNCEPQIISGNHKCDCTSQAGLMQSGILWVCESQTAVATYIADISNLDADDALGFVLHDSPDMTLGTMYLTNSIPEFDYDPVLTLGQTYYISAVVGNDDGSGFPVLDNNADLCLSIAAGQPVVFYPEPTAAMSGDATICEGDSASIIFSLSGMGPFDIVLSDGSNTLNYYDLNDGDILKFVPISTTTYTLMSVSGSDPSACSGSVGPGGSTVTIAVLEIPKISNLSTSCNNDGTAYFISFDVSGGNPAAYTLAGDSTATLTSSQFTSSWYNSGTPYYFEITDDSGCPAVIVTATEYCNCTPDIKPQISISQAISCFGAADGSLDVTNVNGEPPFHFDWSTGNTGTSLSGLAPGLYIVTMTDGNNCERIDSVLLSEPAPISAQLLADSTSCHDTDDGQITFANASGGSGDYTFYLGNTYSYTDSVFRYLATGQYIGQIVDSEGCSWSDTVSIGHPVPFVIQANGDTTISRGGTADISVAGNYLIDSISWRPNDDLNCSNCLQHFVSPVYTTRYDVVAYNEQGCRAEAQLHVTVSSDYPIYIPTAFTPNGDGQNDKFTIYGGEGVEQIRLLRIFNRWGELLFEAQDIPIGVESEGWDGLTGGEKLPVGVYVYYAEVDFEDGSSEMFKGDVSLLKTE